MDLVGVRHWKRFAQKKFLASASLFSHLFTHVPMSQSMFWSFDDVSCCQQVRQASVAQGSLVKVHLCQHVIVIILIPQPRHASTNLRTYHVIGHWLIILSFFHHKGETHDEVTGWQEQQFILLSHLLFCFLWIICEPPQIFFLPNFLLFNLGTKIRT